VAPPADVVVAETPPLFVARAGVFYARLKHAPFILNVSDRWPASAVELGVLTNRGVIRAAEWLEEEAYARASAIAVPTSGLAASLRGVVSPPAKIVVYRPLSRSNAFGAVNRRP